MDPDVIIVGAGLTGSVIARLLTDAGWRALIVERRNHTGGNVHDTVHASGIRVHTYGPHYFRCNSEKIWSFVQRFSDFYPYQAVVKSLVRGQLETWPLNEDTVAQGLTDGWQPGTSAPGGFMEACLARIPPRVYDQFIKGYTQKQWGCPPSSLQARLASRIPIHPRGEWRLTPHHRYQGLPARGYASFMAAMVGGIELRMNFDFIRDRQFLPRAAFLIFTGPIDEFFGYDLGRLEYRAQKRTVRYFAADKTRQPCAQVNYPGRTRRYIRTVEWKYLMPDEGVLNTPGTVITYETPFSAQRPNDYEYPFPDSANTARYERYRARADAMPNVIFCGRLGEYRYLDMDQAIGRAMTIAEKLIASRARTRPPQKLSTQPGHL
jgi:UDP-galactopyranose mutase